MKHANIDDIKQLANKIEDVWSLCEFLPMHEANDLVAQTIHACVKNHSNHGEAFSFLGNGMGYSPTSICNYGGAYDDLLERELFIEDIREGRTVIFPTQLLIDKLHDFLS